MSDKSSNNPNRDRDRLAGHSKLEPRRLLNADFSFVAAGGALTLDGFVDSVPADANRVELSQSGDDFIFTLEDGVWNNSGNGTPTAGISLNMGMDMLTVDSSLVTLNSIFIDSTTADQFGIDFDSFDFSGDISVSNSTGVEFSDVSQNTGTQLTTTPNAMSPNPTLDISGAALVSLGNTGNDFNIVAINDADDVVLNDTNSIQLGNINVASSAGGLDVSTDNSGDITQLAGTSIVVSGEANFDADTSGVVGLREANDFQDLVSATGSTVEILDINDLEISDISAIDDIRLESGFGDGDSNGNGIIDGVEVARTGGIQLGDLTTTSSNGQILLQTDDFINDGSTGTITTSELLIQTNLEPTSGAFDTNGGFIQLLGDNQVDRLAISSDIPMAINGGPFEFEFSNDSDLEIANLTYQSVGTLNTNIVGMDVLGDVRLVIDGDLTQAADAPVFISGSFGLLSSGSTADNIHLTNESNDFDTIAINGINTGRNSASQHRNRRSK